MLGKSSPTETDPSASIYSFVLLVREVLGSHQNLAEGTEVSHGSWSCTHTASPVVSVLQDWCNSYGG